MWFWIGARAVKNNSLAVYYSVECDYLSLSVVNTFLEDPDEDT